MSEGSHAGLSRAARAARWAVLVLLGLFAAGETLVRREAAAFQRGTEVALAPQEQQARVLRAALEAGRGVVDWPEHDRGRLDLSPDPSTYHRRLPEVNTVLRPGDPPRWLVLGGSNVFGVCEAGEHLTSVFTRVHVERTGERVDAVNMGRLDGGPVDALRDYALHGRRFDHQGVILLVDLGRDLERTVTPTRWHLREDGGSWEVRAPVVDRRERGLRALLRASALLRAIDDARGAAADRREAMRQKLIEASLARRGAVDAAYRQEGWFLHRQNGIDGATEALREVLRRLQEQTREEGVPLVIVPLQTPRQLTPRPFAMDSLAMERRLGLPRDGVLMEDRVEEAVRSIAGELGIRMIDLRPRWQEWLGAYPDDLIFWRANWHLSSRGHFVVGEQLAFQLEGDNRAFVAARAAAAPEGAP